MLLCETGWNSPQILITDVRGRLLVSYCSAAWWQGLGVLTLVCSLCESHSSVWCCTASMLRAEHLSTPFKVKTQAFQCDRLLTPTPPSIVCVAAPWCGRAEYFHSRWLVLFFKQNVKYLLFPAILNIKIFCFFISSLIVNEEIWGFGSNL